MIQNKQRIATASLIALLVVVVAAATAVITIGSFTSSKNIIAAAVAQQNGVTGTPTITASSASARTFYLFNTNHDGVNVTKLGIAPDAYSPEALTVTAGDTVVVHFYNVDTTDRHSFTLAGPYNVDVDLAPGQHSVFTFKASHQGVFGFFCKYHPTMTGQLIVLPPPPSSPSSVEGISAS